jgi:hypothetical protein
VLALCGRYVEMCFGKEEGGWGTGVTVFWTKVVKEWVNRRFPGALLPSATTSNKTAAVPESTRPHSRPHPHHHHANVNAEENLTESQVDLRSHLFMIPLFSRLLQLLGIRCHTELLHHFSWVPSAAPLGLVADTTTPNQETSPSGRSPGVVELSDESGGWYACARQFLISQTRVPAIVEIECVTKEMHRIYFEEATAIARTSPHLLPLAELKFKVGLSLKSDDYRGLLCILKKFFFLSDQLTKN